MSKFTDEFVEQYGTTGNLKRITEGLRRVKLNKKCPLKKTKTKLGETL